MPELTIEQALQLARRQHEAGKLAEAEAIYRQIVAQRPDHCGAVYNLGVALADQLKLEEAARAFARAIELQPDFAWAHTNLGRALRDLGKLDNAIRSLSRGIELSPQSAIGHSNLGRAFRDQGKLDEALACYDRAMALEPSDPSLHSNRVYTLHFHPGFDAPAILREHQLWAQRHALPLQSEIRAFSNDRLTARRLRIGYVSPDFRLHPVGKFLLPLLQHHDHGSFEIFCYSDVRQPDALTAAFQSTADAWRKTLGVPDAQLAKLIRQDRIDILVDLAMHLADNRLLVFARKPAPVQVTYLAYPSTTGIQSMDYRLTDSYLDPPGETDAHYCEKSMRLSDSYWCYDPVAMQADSFALAPLPATANGFVTFGCMNNFCKVTAGVVSAWAKILAAVPDSRLILHAEEGQHRQHLIKRLAENSIAGNRISFVARQAPEEYFRIHDRIDIALDTFPYNGGTTTCDALWMGAPLVTLIGRTAVGRAGWTILSNLGLRELAAHNEDDYVRIAVELARDVHFAVDGCRALCAQRRDELSRDVGKILRARVLVVTEAQLQLFRQIPAAASDETCDAIVCTTSVSPAAKTVPGVGGDSSTPADVVRASTRPLYPSSTSAMRLPSNGLPDSICTSAATCGTPLIT